MEGGGLQSESEASSITATFAVEGNLRAEERGVRLEETGLLLFVRPADP